MRSVRSGSKNPYVSVGQSSHNVWILGIAASKSSGSSTKYSNFKDTTCLCGTSVRRSRINLLLVDLTETGPRKSTEKFAGDNTRLSREVKRRSAPESSS